MDYKAHDPEGAARGGGALCNRYCMVGTCIMDYKAPPPRAAPSGSWAL